MKRVKNKIITLLFSHTSGGQAKLQKVVKIGCVFDERKTNQHGDSVVPGNLGENKIWLELNHSRQQCDFPLKSTNLG